MNSNSPIVFDPQAVAPDGFHGTVVGIGVAEAAERTADLSGVASSDLINTLEGFPTDSQDPGAAHIRVELEKRANKPGESEAEAANAFDLIAADEADAAVKQLLALDSSERQSLEENESEAA